MGTRAAEDRSESTIDWNALLAPYRSPVLWSSIWQLASTATLFIACWALMYWSLSVGYWLTLLLAAPTAMMVVRLFMLQHDCGHGSFFTSRRANSIVGSILGVITLVPYTYWRKTHAIHHATSATSTRSPWRSISRSRGASGFSTDSIVILWCFWWWDRPGSSCSSTACRSTSRGAGSGNGPACTGPTSASLRRWWGCRGWWVGSAS